MNRRGQSTDRVRDGGEFGAGGLEWKDDGIALQSVVAAVVVVAVVCCFGFWSVLGRSVWSVFHSFRFAVCLEARNRISFSNGISSQKIILK